MTEDTVNIDRADWHAEQERQIYRAAGIDPGDLSGLSDNAVRVVRCLAVWDEEVVRGVMELLHVARKAGADGPEAVGSLLGDREAVDSIVEDGEPASVSALDDRVCVCPAGDTLPICRVHGLDYDGEGYR